MARIYYSEQQVSVSKVRVSYTEIRAHKGACLWLGTRGSGGCSQVFKYVKCANIL
jgi:hypothetical protein